MRKSKKTNRDFKGKSGQGKPRGPRPSQNVSKQQSAVKSAPKQAKVKSNKIDNLTLFGMHAVREAWLNPTRAISALYITQNMLEDFTPHIHAAQKAGLKRPEPVLVDKARLDGSFPEGTVHQGIALRTELLPEYNVHDLMRSGALRIKEEGKRSLILMLDQVTDPHNIGAIIRSASAFQITGMVVQKKHTPPLQGIVGKTACGGLDHLMIAHETNLSRTIEQLKDEGYFVIGLDERGEESLEEFNVPERCVFILGAEGPGLRRLTKESCDQMIKLPTGGAVGSLNVSNAAAICLYGLTTAPKR
ncbi:MAG: 23S rRNA (guanosine(2251)-2'-O)-methyltransferase RlmB [Pseudomonadota bacterium]|nr:23S rRNA (guanosine(2251)-2'-O)-methyltransferase RlmB [Pseudomonadota bacterium]MEC9235896.1 23S rRNA (guanosine(2251)-2'-O)-methyltransferase RlmB [Pseudomonadota bacterium]MED5423563.1 23S rRNA (guanosine(2251)-2'-O)-methyltransferase RlmB [Pseudomonadota bacterium]|tara:strand:- start:428042 stop:428950 length:909 start_codon:yes stop_codon:yes gene_type:complete